MTFDSFYSVFSCGLYINHGKIHYRLKSVCNNVIFEYWGEKNVGLYLVDFIYIVTQLITSSYIILSCKVYYLSFLYMWHDQGEWVGCREYWLWVTGLKRWQILMFFIVFKLQRMFISPQLDIRLRWGLDQNVAFVMDKWLMLKTQNWILPTCDSFPLIMSHIVADIAINHLTVH